MKRTSTFLPAALLALATAAAAADEQQDKRSAEQRYGRPHLNLPIRGRKVRN